MFISTVSRTQPQAMMALVFFLQPALLISGFIFPIGKMPTIVQSLSLLNPLRHFLVIIRGVFLKGTGLAVVWPEVLGLLALGAALLGLSARRVRTRLE